MSTKQRTYSSAVSKRREATLVAALTSKALVAREIVAITGWDDTHMSIRKAIKRVADRNALRVTVSARKHAETGRTMLHYRART